MNIRHIIESQLIQSEIGHNVSILYAAESGSRAWGFPSPDSDFDARFIYVHSKEYYLSIEEQRDVIELPIDAVLDINGWDLRKALKLFRKSNAPVFEWLQSPIVYKSNPEFHAEMNSLMPRYFSPRGMFHHYLSMAKSVIAGPDLSGAEVKLKKYFYALRPLLACKWILDYNEVPPMEFGKLRILLDEDLQGIVNDLLDQKSKLDETFTIKPIKELNAWITNSQEYNENHQPLARAVSDDHEDLNQLFRKFLK
ncbi:MAG: nucleotidyltransferase domain-containing protein [Cyclobacteriaceae bacterium]|nr:nucleotidyltransferase domain-containing protein [Cyclobacteriaceae bacterium]